ncbi:uncharacterized protein [Branchiostoma lanceolatum]|uniref:uncharacterized protein n=1 Tax=Branchiostoma lanceolatum TaxID=7740 RepID=UPI00345535F8
MKLFVCTLVTMVVIAMLIDDSDAYRKPSCPPSRCPFNCGFGYKRQRMANGCIKCVCSPSYFKRGEGLEEEERSLQDELDQKLDARELEGLEEEVRSLLDGLKEKLDARELEGLEEDYARRRR